MVNAAPRFWPACVLVLLCISGLHAKDLPDYRTGDTAEADITTPVPLDVIDPDATAARKAVEAMKTPAIFRNYPDTTNAVENNFLAALANARSSFLADYKNAVNRLALEGQGDAPPDIASLVAAFNRKNKTLPLTTGLAESWAGGGDGLAVQNTLVRRLREAMRRPIRADNLPDHFALGDTVRLVTVGDPQETLTLDDAERRGKIATETSVATLTRARMLLRNAFPADEQSLARAMAAFLKPDCVFDENLTQQSRDRQTAQLAVAAHYDAGQIIVRQGQMIDAKAMAALDQLNEKMLPGKLNEQIVVERDQARREQEQAQEEHEQAVQAGNLAQSEREQALKLQTQAADAQNQALKIRARNEWLLVTLAGVSTVALAAFWILARGRRREVPLLPARLEKKLPQNLAPQLAQAFKEAVVQELAAQRGELLKAQQNAAAEISELVHRLDRIQAPMQERLRIYETRIAELEKELAARSEENHELLKLKIEMIRRQLETERAGNRMEFN